MESDPSTDPRPRRERARPRFSWQALLRAAGSLLLALPRPLAWLLPFAWMGLIWFLSAQRIDAPGGAFGLWGFLGNWAHAPLFGFLALFWTALLLRPWRGIDPGRWPRLEPRVAALVMLLVGGYGVIDELHQRATGGRQSSAMDVVTDLAGAACVLWVVSALGSPAPGAPAVGERGLRLRLIVGVVGTALVAWAGLF